MIPAGFEGMHYARTAWLDGHDAGLAALARGRVVSAEDAADDHSVHDADYHHWCEGYENAVASVDEDGR